MRPRQLIDYLGMALIWGFSFLLLLRVVQAFGWVGAIAFRALIASGALLAMALATRRRLVFGRWRPLALVGATTVAGQLIGLSVATPLIGTAMTAIVVGTIPLFSMVIGQLWGLERVSGPARSGLLLGFAGIVLLVGFPAVPVSGTFLGGCAVALFGAACAALGSNVASRYLASIGSWEQTIGAFFFGGALMLPMLIMVPVPGTPAPVDYAYLAALALLCSSLAYVLYFRLVAEAGATIAISVEFVVTVIAVLVGALLLGEHLSVIQLVGGAVIVAGCALVLGLVPGRRLSGP
ncbi:DMT family transporter [Luedemannella helvata]|uniref:DMT family transporter n=1 Tax=Luedemannella helvata TaxID=349315 RepID=A0ABP4W2C2_9ACTN